MASFATPPWCSLTAYRDLCPRIIPLRKIKGPNLQNKTVPTKCHNIYSTSLNSKFARLCSILYNDCSPLMFRPCSTYVWTVLDLCLDCAGPMFRPCWTYVWTVLDLCFDFLGRNRVFRLCSTYVSTFSAEIGYVLTL